MINSTFGITKLPFVREKFDLLPQQKAYAQNINVHAQHGGFSVIIGQPGVGKSVLREHIEQMDEQKDTVVASVSRTIHTYINILKQLALALRLEVKSSSLENDIIQAAYGHIRDRKTVYTLIDEAHLLDMNVLRKLRLLFDRFPKKHNLVLFGQSDLMHYLSMSINRDIKSRITYSASLLPMSDDDMEHFIIKELETVKLGLNTFNEGALELIVRSVQGNLRLCRNLCYGSLIEACQEGKRHVSITHVNNVLIQPHWRSHEEIIKQQVA